MKLICTNIHTQTRTQRAIETRKGRSEKEKKTQRENKALVVVKQQ